MSAILDSRDFSGSEPSITWLLEASDLGGTVEIPYTVQGETYSFRIDVELVEGDRP